MTLIPNKYDEESKYAIIDRGKTLVVEEICRDRPLSEFPLPTLSGQPIREMPTYEAALDVLNQREQAVRDAHAALVELDLKRTDIQRAKRDTKWPQIQALCTPLPTGQQYPDVPQALTLALNDQHIDQIDLRPIRIEAECAIVGEPIAQDTAQTAHTDPLREKIDDIKFSRRMILKTQTTLSHLRTMQESGEYTVARQESIRRSIEELERRIEITTDPVFRSDTTTGDTILDEVARLNTLSTTLHDLTKVNLGTQNKIVHLFNNSDTGERFNERLSTLNSAIKNYQKALGYTETPLRDVGYGIKRETFSLTTPENTTICSVDLYDPITRFNETINVLYGNIPTDNDNATILTPIRTESVRYRAVPYETTIPFDDDDKIVLGNDGLPIIYTNAIICRVDNGDWYPVTPSNLQSGVGKPRRVRPRFGHL